LSANEPVTLAPTSDATASIAEAGPAPAPAPSRRFALLAASVAAAAVLGSATGSLMTALFQGSPATAALVTPAPAVAASGVSREAFAQLGADVAALKISLDSTSRSANTQLTRIGERFDRIERAQGEPSQKLAKIAEALDRLERRPVATVVASPDTTGSIGPKTIDTQGPETKAAEAKAAEAAKAIEAAKAAKPPVLDGWSIAGVRRGRVFVESRYGVFEVMPGTRLPNLGRVEDVSRQDGRLVVVTSKGLIVR
jgi:hypothetical protein